MSFWVSHVNALKQKEGLILAKIPNCYHPATNLVKYWSAESPLVIYPTNDLAKRTASSSDISVDKAIQDIWDGKPIAKTYIWIGFNSSHITDLVLLDTLYQRCRLIIIVSSFKYVTLLESLRYIYTLYQPIWDDSRIITELRVEENSIDEINRLIRESSGRILLLLPDSLFSKYQQLDWPENVILSSSILEKDWDVDLIINTGREDVTDYTMTLGSYVKPSYQTKQQREFINRSINKGEVIHLTAKFSEPKLNWAQIYYWLYQLESRGLVSIRLKNMFAFQYQTLVFWTNRMGKLTWTTHLSYKWEFIARQINDIEGYILAALISAYNQDSIIKINADNQKLVTGSSVETLITLWNCIVYNVPTKWMEGRIVWNLDQVKLVCTKLAFNLDYIIRTKQILESCSISLDQELKIIDWLKLRTRVQPWLEKCYFPFTKGKLISPVSTSSTNPLVIMAVNKFQPEQPVFYAKDYNDYLTSVGLEPILYSILQPNAVNFLVTDVPDTVYPIEILDFRPVSQIGLFWA